MKPTVFLALLVILTTAVASDADVFVYLDQNNEQQTLHARLAGSGQGFLALERDDGAWQLVAEEDVRARTPGDDPVPVSAEEMAQRLEEQFTAPLFKHRIAEPFVVGLVLTAPLDEEAQPRVDRFFDKAATFLQSISRVFSRFAEKMDISLEPPRFPLVMLIFETDAAFNAYTEASTSGGGLSSNVIAGFYSGVTNWLAIRLDECDTFAVPLHEAIHQQTYNRGMLQRLAPVPTWFDEGIATGFENDGARISVDPTRINRLYGGKARQKFQLRFAEIIRQDNAFHGDVIAGEAYTLAWCLHWMLVTSKPDEYTQYLKKLRSIEPLSDNPSSRRLVEFERTFGLKPDELEQTIGRALAAASRKQRVRLSPPTVPVGKLIAQDQMGKLEVGLVRRANKGGLVQGIGKLKNLSPFRTLTFRVSVTQGGRGIAWLAESVDPNRGVDLERKLMPPSGNSTYSVDIRSAIPGTPEERILQELPR